MLIKEKFTNFEKNNKVDPRLINNLSEKINSLFDNIKECENFSKMVKKKMNFYSTECRYYKGLE